MAAKEKKTKAQIAAAAAAGARSKKKKWAKGKRQEKAPLSVHFDSASSAALLKDVPRMKLITPYLVSEKLRVNLSLARQGLRKLETDGLIRRVSGSVGSFIFTRA